MKSDQPHDSFRYRRQVLATAVVMGLGCTAILLKHGGFSRHSAANTENGRKAPSPSSAQIEDRALLPVLPSPGTNRSALTVDAIEVLAQSKPQEALALALAQGDSAISQDLIAAALRGWAKTNPDAAADWLQAHETAHSERALAGIFEAASQYPERALALAQRLAQTKPNAAREYGYALIASLNQVGQFEKAAGYAASDPSRWQPDLVIAAYHDWGRHQPEQALVFAIHLPDSPARETAIQSVLSGWARDNPEAMAKAVIKFPEGADKKSALIKAVRAWIIKDPEKARDWILAHDAAIPAAAVALRED